MSRIKLAPPDGRSDEARDQAIVATLSGAARRVAADQAGPGPTPAVWHRLQARRQGGVEETRAAARPWGRRGWLVGAVAAAAVAVVAGDRLVRPGPAPLTYAVARDDQQGDQDDGYIRGVQPNGADVRFSDGTRVQVGQGARMSVLARSARGARLRVEEGRARFDVVHRDNAAWSVEAGPFVVLVTGTAFDVRWSGTDETVEVRLHVGSVEIAGPLVSGRVKLRAGQRLVARLATGQLTVDERSEAPAAESRDVAPTRGTGPAPEARAEPAPAAPPTAATTAAAAPEPATSPPARVPGRRLAHRTSAGESGRGAAANTETWAARVASGDAATIVNEAEASDLDRTLGTVDVAALAALADAARYVQRRDLAERALNAQRRRFPGTLGAQAAAFMLGRLADERRDDTRALEWYRTYLSEAPRGPYASEALGRKMLAVERIPDRLWARAIASEYVRRFPNGTYLLQANAILGTP